MELRQYVMVVWKRWWLVILTTVLAAAAALIGSLWATPVYRSTVTLEVIAGSDPAESAQQMERNVLAIAGTYVRQVPAPTVMEGVAARLGLALSPDEVAKFISASQVRDAGMLQISAEHADPQFARALAETTAEVFIEQRAAQQQARYATSLTELDAQVAELEGEIMRTRSAIAELGDPRNLSVYGRSELARLETQLSNNQTRLSILLNSTEQFRLAMARYSDYLAVFRPAELPRSPVSPQPLRSTALATVVGGMIGVGTAFLLDYLDDSIHTPEDARAALGVNVLGAVPAMKDDDEAAGWLPQAQPLSPTAEAFRDLRASLQYASLDVPLRTLLVTSTEPGDGKTFIATNLATAFALAGRKVLLMDADLRRPQIHRLWGEARSPGLSDTLVDLSQLQADEEEMDDAMVLRSIRPTHIESLFLLSAGTRVTTPAEMLNSETFQSLIGALLIHFDMIVLDTPPVLTVSDVTGPANSVDGVVLVTASGETSLPAAARAIDRIGSIGGNLLGLVVNRLTARSGGYYYHYYRYNYDDVYRDEQARGDNGASPGKQHTRRSVRAEEAQSRG